MGIVAIFGGTFNPIHVGHREILDKLSGIDNIEKIILIPTKIPPHKQVAFLASEEDRVNMCKLIASKYPNVEVSDLELRREGKSYTIDTLKSVKQIYPDKTVAITIGADMVVTFDEWKDYTDIIRNSVLITFSRAGTDQTIYNNGIKVLKNMGAQIIEIEEEITNVSSTQIRDALLSNSCTAGLLDTEVYEYILENKVYGA